MTNKQDALFKHYRDVYQSTHRMEHNRDRTYVFLVLTLIASTYLAFDKDVAQDLLAALATRLSSTPSEELRAALRKINFYRVFSVISLLASLYLMVNLHHQHSTLRRNYRYLSDLEREIREELAIDPGKTAFTKESTHYWTHRPAFFTFARITYGAVVALLVCLFLAVRIVTDWPTAWPTDAPKDFASIWQYRQFVYEQLLFLCDLVLGLPLVIASFAYLVASNRRPAPNSRRDNH